MLFDRVGDLLLDRAGGLLLDPLLAGTVFVLGCVADTVFVLYEMPPTVYVGFVELTRTAAADTSAVLTAASKVAVATIEPAESLTAILDFGMPPWAMSSLT